MGDRQDLPVVDEDLEGLKDRPVLSNWTFPRRRGTLSRVFVTLDLDQGGAVGIKPPSITASSVVFHISKGV